MPASKKTTAAAASTAGRALAQGQKAPGARAVKRATKAAPIPTQSDETAQAVRRAPQDASAYAVTAWGETTFELTTPSGQTCLCRELGIEGLIEMGLLDALNGLSGIVVSEVLPKAKGTPPPKVNLEQMMADPKQLVTVVELLNKVVVAAVVAPRIHAVPEGDEERVVGNVYVDSIPLQDRMFLFTELTGGLDQFASFR